jgi:hypothetical protein
MSPNEPIPHQRNPTTSLRLKNKKYLRRFTPMPGRQVSSFVVHFWDHEGGGGFRSQTDVDWGRDPTEAQATIFTMQISIN